MLHRNQLDRIEQFHLGNMSAEEASLFEKELNADPALKAESDLQADIINSLKEYRKLQLKTRLESIEIGSSWFEFAQQSALVKSFGGIALATAIGTGIYFLADKEDASSELENSVYIEAVESPALEEKGTFEWTLTPLATEATVKVPVVSEPETQRKSVKKVETTLPATVAQESFTPDFVAPDASDVEEGAIESVKLDDVVETVSVAIAEETPLNIETENTRGNKIKYKYFDGNLYLSGNFKEEPYEIIEINGASGRRLYLLHNRKYYEIKLTDRMTELPEVRNIKLIQELRLIKANK